MRTILAYTDAYRLEPSGRDEREQVARQQFSEAGLTLDDRKAHQLTFGKSEDSANARFRTEIDTSKSRSREGDLFYVDWEPEHYSHPTKFDLRKANFMSALVRRTVFEYDGDVGVYGLPYNRYWPPFTTKSAVQALTYIHTKTPLDYFSPSCYLNKQAGDRSDQDFIFRQTYPISICRRLDPTKPIRPFVQPVLRGGSREYEEMTDETIELFWKTLCYLGVSEVIWWYESGRNGELVEGMGRRLARHAPIMNEVFETTTLGG